MQQVYLLKINNSISEYEIEFKCKTLPMLLDFCKQELTEFYDKQDSIKEYYDKDYYKTMLIFNRRFIRFGIAEKYTLSLTHLTCKDTLDAIMNCINEFFYNLSDELNNNNCDCEKCINSIDNNFNVIR